jgi:regulator of protease activity HflC (stomatin/prohibitin superfamily)
MAFCGVPVRREDLKFDRRPDVESRDGAAMKADYVTYQKATARCFIGAIVHAVLGVALLVYGAKFSDHTAVTAAWFITLGVFIWLGLAIVHDQQRRERIEALEQESLSSDQGGSVFESTGDFRVAGKRLEFVEKWILPILSLLFGAALIALGLWRFNQARTILDETTFQGVFGRGWAIALWAIAAAVGFPFARYVAGMAKQPAWAKLRAGAGISVAMALMGLASLVAHLVDIWGPDAPLRWMQTIVPIVIVILGVEVFVNFLLDLYRPRKAGEVRSIAADSRLMSFAAAPDRIAESASEAINYQFGYNVTSTWLYQLLSRSVANLVIVGLLIGWLLSCATVILPHQRGLVLRFGDFAREIGPGLHLKLPWPMERVSIPSYFERDEKGRVVEKGETTTGVRTLQLAKPPQSKDRQEAVLWTNEHGAGEVFFIVRPSPLQVSKSSNQTPDSAWLSDMALMAFEIPMQYAVKDAKAFESLGEPMQREAILKATAQRAVMRVLKGYSVDDILGPGRVQIAPKIKEAINAAFAVLNPPSAGKTGGGQGAGVEVLSVSVIGVHPAKSVAPAFEKVVQAEQGAEGLLEATNASAAETLIRTTGSKELARKLVDAIELKDKMTAEKAPADKVRSHEAMISSLLAECQGQVARTLSEAKAERWEKNLGMRERSLRYSGQVASFEANESLFRAHMYYDALLASMRRTRLVVTDDTRDMGFRIDLQDKSTDGGFSVLDSEVSTPPP